MSSSYLNYKTCILLCWTLISCNVTFPFPCNRHKQRHLLLLSVNFFFIFHFFSFLLLALVFLLVYCKKASMKHKPIITTPFPATAVVTRQLTWTTLWLKHDRLSPCQRGGRKYSIFYLSSPFQLWNDWQVFSSRHVIKPVQSLNLWF